MDIVVWFEKGEKFNNFINLVFFIEKLSGRKVDLFTLESISPYTKPYIEKEIICKRV
ncbi:MAG: hypothetical protein J7K23_10020 [Thermoproteales archaeon]|nr:hypothetical protein [Thermoproteales archaeon]